MDFSVHSPGELIGSDDPDGTMLFRVPVTFELGKDELVTLREVNVKNIRIKDDSGSLVDIEHSSKARVLVIENGVVIEPKLPIVLRPDASGCNKIIFEMRLLKSGIEKIVDRKNIFLIFSAIFKTMHPIVFQIIGQFESGQPNTFTVENIERKKNPFMVFVNLLLFLIPALLFSQWNSLFNENVYSEEWIPKASIINSVLFFMSGFLGLQLSNGMKMLKSATEIGPLYKFPELYLTSSTFQVFKSGISTIILILLAVGYVYIVHNHRIVALPDSKELGDKFVIVDQRVRILNPIKEKKTYIQDIDHLRIMYLYDQNKNTVWYGRLKVDPSSILSFRTLKSYPEWYNFKITYNNNIITNKEFNGRSLWNEEDNLSLHAAADIMATLKGHNDTNATHSVKINNSDVLSSGNNFIDILVDEGIQIDLMTISEKLEKIVLEYIDKIEKIPVKKSEYLSFVEEVVKIAPESSIFPRHMLACKLNELLNDVYKNNLQRGKNKLFLAMGLIEIYAKVNENRNENLPIDEIKQVYLETHKRYKIEDSKSSQPDKNLVALYWNLLFRLEELEGDHSCSIEELIEKVWIYAGAERFFLLLESTVAYESLSANTIYAEKRRNFLKEKASVMDKWEFFQRKLADLINKSDKVNSEFLSIFKTSSPIVSKAHTELSNPPDTHITLRNY